MKDELNGDINGLRAKMYSVKTKKKRNEEGKESKEEDDQKDISHQFYVDCLFKERKFIHTMQSIKSFKH